MIENQLLIVVFIAANDISANIQNYLHLILADT